MYPDQILGWSEPELKIYLVFWDIIARQMPGLTFLSVTMHYPRQKISRDITAQWHVPLQNVRGLERFELKICDQDFREGESVSSEMVALKRYLEDIVCSSAESRPPEHTPQPDLGYAKCESGWRSGYVVTKPQNTEIQGTFPGDLIYP